VKWIATQDLLIAHRLHANIVAYSCGVPHIGLGWDPKLKNFFESVGRGDFIISKDVTDPRTIPDLAARTVREGIDADKHKKVLDETRATIANLAAIILKCKKAKAA
jgi:polysaccharide pyruvyl transferase WcaK-like protein